MDQPPFLFQGDQQFNLVLTLLKRVLHDLNNPISTIDSSAGFLLSVDADPDRRRRMLEIIQGETRRLKSMTAAMGQLTRVEPPRPRPSSIQSLQNRLTLDHKASLDASNIHLQFLAPEDAGPLEVFTDPALLSFIVGNLLANARQALKAAGIGGKVLVAFLPGPDAMELEVSDSGPGIAPALRPRLFEPFCSGRENGLGLGLYVSAQAAAAMGAALSLVEAQDASLGGARFRLRIPNRAL